MIKAFKGIFNMFEKIYNVYREWFVSLMYSLLTIHIVIANILVMAYYDKGGVHDNSKINILVIVYIAFICLLTLLFKDIKHKDNDLNTIFKLLLACLSGFLVFIVALDILPIYAFVITIILNILIISLILKHKDIMEYISKRKSIKKEVNQLRTIESILNKYSDKDNEL